MRISDWSSDVCSSDLRASTGGGPLSYVVGAYYLTQEYDIAIGQFGTVFGAPGAGSTLFAGQRAKAAAVFGQVDYEVLPGLTLTAGGRYSYDKKRAEEHTSELQSLMRISYAVCCLKKKKRKS